MVLKGNTTGNNTVETVIEKLQINKSKVERIYEDDDWVIDKVGDDIRVSYFNDFHFVDEKLITKEQFESKN